MAFSVNQSSLYPSNRYAWGVERPNEVSRAKALDYCDVCTCSYVPDVWLKNVDLSFDKPRNLKKVKKIKIKKFTDDIENHVENRIQLFFQQLLLFYKKDLCFQTYLRTDDQVGAIKNGSGVAAHSSTLTVLRLKSDHFSSSTSAAFGTSFYYDWNATVYLPSLVNEFDKSIDIDCKINGKPLREIATRILNKVSKGKKTPAEGLSSFLDSLYKISKISKKEKKDSEDHVKVALIYMKIAKNYQNQLKNPDSNHLIQKLCFEKTTKVVNKNFFEKVSNKMHHYWDKKKEAIPFSSVTPDQMKAKKRAHFDVIVKIIKERIEKITKKNRSKKNGESGKVLEYIRECTTETAEKVYCAAINYLNFLHPLTKKEKKNKIKSFLSEPPKTGKSVEALFFRALLKKIKEVNGSKNPQNQPVIIGKVLLNWIEKCKKMFPAERKSARLIEKAKEKIKKYVDLKRPAKPFTPKLKKHIKTCLESSKVKKIAKEVLESLIDKTSAEQEMTINLISRCNNSKGRKDGNEATSIFFAAGREVIPKGKNIHLILMEVFYQVNFPTV